MSSIQNQHFTFPTALRDEISNAHATKPEGNQLSEGIKNCLKSPEIQSQFLLWAKTNETAIKANPLLNKVFHQINEYQSTVETTDAVAHPIIRHSSKRKAEDDTSSSSSSPAAAAAAAASSSNSKASKKTKHEPNAANGASVQSQAAAGKKPKRKAEDQPEADKAAAMNDEPASESTAPSSKKSKIEHPSSSSSIESALEEWVGLKFQKLSFYEENPEERVLVTQKCEKFWHAMAVTKESDIDSYNKAISLLNSYSEAGLLSPLHVHQFFDDDLSDVVLPWFEIFSSEQLIQLLTTEDDERGAPIFSGVKFLQPMLERKLSTEQLMQLLMFRDTKRGATPLHYYNIIVIFVPLLKKVLSSEQIVHLLSLKRKGDYYTPLRHHIDICLPLLEQLSFEQMMQVLSIKGEGESVDKSIVDCNSVHTLMPILERLSFEQLMQVLSINKKEDKYPIINDYSLPKLMPLLERFSSEQIMQVLTKKVDKDRISIQSNSFFPEYLTPLLSKLSAVQLMQLLAIKNPKDGTTLSKNYSTVLSFLPLFEKFSVEQLEDLSADQLVYFFELTYTFGSWQGKDNAMDEGFVLLLKRKLSNEQIVQVLSTTDPRNNTRTAWQHGGTTTKLLPLLEQLSFEQFMEVVSVRDENGNILMQYPSIKELIPALHKFSAAQLKQLFMLKSEEFDCCRANFHLILEAISPLFDKFTTMNEILSVFEIEGNSDIEQLEVFEFMIRMKPVLGKWSSDELIKFLRAGRALVSYTNENLPLLSPLIEKLSVEQLLELMFHEVFDDSPEILYLSDEVISNLMPLLQKKLESKHLMELLFLIISKVDLSSQNQSKILKQLVPLYDKLDAEQLFEFLALMDANGKTLMTSPDFAQGLTPLIEKRFTTEDLTQFISTLFLENVPVNMLKLYVDLKHVLEKKWTYDQIASFLSVAMQCDDQGAHSDTFTEKIIAWLDNFSTEQLMQTLSRPETIKKLISPEFMAFLSRKLSAEQYNQVFDIKDKDGIPFGCYFVEFSKEWIAKPKAVEATVEITSIDYTSRAEKLTTDVLALYNALNFGKKGEEIKPGEISPVVFEMRKVESVNTVVSKEEVVEALTIMLAKIEQELAWLSTPRVDEPDKLHTWYSGLLVNFEKVRDELMERKDPDQTAGILTAIAKTELQKRCGSAYREEIRQSSRILQGVEGMEMKSVLEGVAINALMYTLEKICRTKYQGGNVHFMSTFLHAAGFDSEPDSLPPMNQEQAQDVILKHFTPNNVVPLLFEGLRNIAKGDLLDWLKEQTPPDYNIDNSNAELRNKASAFEQETLAKLGTELDKIGMTEKQKNDFIVFITSTRGTSLIYKELSSSTPTTPLRENFKPGKEGLVQFKQAMNAFDADVLSLANRNKTIEEIEKVVGDGHLNDKLIAIKLETDQTFKQWMTDNGIGYFPANFALASQSLDSERRRKYAENHLDEKGILNLKGYNLFLETIQLKKIILNIADGLLLRSIPQEIGQLGGDR